MSLENERTCPECKGAALPIKIIDHAFMGDRQLDYAVAEADRIRWTGLFPIEGTIASYMCSGCGRVLLYGQKKA